MKDPTQTAAIRKAWESQLKRRFRALRGKINTLFTQGRVPYDLAYVEFFNTWMDREIASAFGGDWQDKYIRDAYMHGLELSGIDYTLTTEHRDAIALLVLKARTDSNAALAAMKDQSIERLTKGIISRTSKREISAEIKDRVNKIGQTRTILNANTMTPYSSNVAEIKAAEGMGESFKMLWITRQDERVRTTHALRNRKLFSAKVAITLLDEPGCRCRVKAVKVDKANVKGYAEIREAGLKISEQAQEEQRFFEISNRQARGYSDATGVRRG